MATRGFSFKGLVDYVLSLKNSLTDRIDNLTAADIGVSNPNILINGDFSVCQRYGSTEVAYTSGANYHADRWWGGMTNPSDGSSFRMKAVAYSSGTCLEVQSVGSMSSLSVVQNVELVGFDKSIGGAEYLNSDITLSVIVVSPVPIACEAQSDIFKIAPIKVVSPLVKSGRQQIPANKYTKLVFTYKTPDRLTESVPTSNLALNFRLVFTAPDGGSLPPCRFILHKVKAERGSVATPFIPDDPATNLMKCQRYFNKMTGGISWSYMADFVTSRNSFGLSSRGFQFTAMRDVPRVALDVNIALDAVTGSTDTSLVKCISSRVDGITISHPVNISGSALKSAYGYIYLNSITLDAEI